MPIAPARLPRWRRRKAWRALAEFVLYALIFAAWACWFGLRPAPPADPDDTPPPPHLSSPQGPPGPRLSCGQGDMPPRIRCESYAVLASLPTWRVYCPGEARGGRVCDMERGVVGLPDAAHGRRMGVGGDDLRRRRAGRARAVGGRARQVGAVGGGALALSVPMPFGERIRQRPTHLDIRAAADAATVAGD